MSMSNQEVYRALVALQESGGTAALCTVIRTSGSVPRREGAKMLVYPDGRIVGTVGGGELEARVIAQAREVVAKRLTATVTIPLVDPAQGDAGVCGGEMDVFVEPLLAESTVLVVGCGHVGKEVAALAKWLGFRVAVTDDRIEFCNPEWVPEADVYLPGTIPEALREFEITDQTFVAAVTRGVKADTQALPHLLGSPAPYVGVIGSRRRWTVAVKELQELGVPEELIRRARAPIGLRIGAETPREIAVSILSEIVAFRQGMDGGSMQWYPPLGDTGVADDCS
jgi:xanthine dehydrogenase accessory factor